MSEHGDWTEKECTAVQSTAVPLYEHRASRSRIPRMYHAIALNFLNRLASIFTTSEAAS